MPKLRDRESRSAEDAIDRLYRLPLNEFTAARRALEKTVPEARGLRKPTWPAWAVNQLYWQERPVFDAVVDAAQKAREALEGKGDVRKAGEAHRRVIAEAVQHTVRILEKAGQRPTSSTVRAILSTFEAAAGGGEFGRLTEPLQPAGFAALGGIVPAKQPRARKGRPATESASARRATEKFDRAARERVVREQEQLRKERVSRAEALVGATERRLQELQEQERLAHEAWSRARERVEQVRGELVKARRELMAARAER